MLVKESTANMAMRFIFYNIITMFGCLRVLMSNRGIPFLNYTICDTICVLTLELTIYQQNIITYHLWVNGIVEELSKILKHGVTKVYDI